MKEKLLTRRRAMKYVASAALTFSLSSEAEDEPHEVRKPFGWLMLAIEGKTVYSRGQGDKVVVLLHELNGLSPGCVDLGVQLADHGFRVYMPLLFGHPTQDSAILGFAESCVFGQFHCFADRSDAMDTPPVLWTQRFVDHLCTQAKIRTIGIIGMCQTGAFPLAVMKGNTKVKAAVMSQPALPFGNDRQRDVGISERTMTVARESGIPILAFRFILDTLCTANRFAFLQERFPQQFMSESFDCSDFHGSLNHRLHAVLTGPCRAVREDARTKLLAFLSAKLD